MTLRVANRVRDTTTTTGTGTLTVTGTAPVGYIPFTSIPSIATNDTYYILIAHQTLNEWEICLGTHASGTTISRGAVEASSNAGSAVTFSAGTKDVVLVQTAGRLIENTLVQSPLIQGGDAASSTLTLQSTSGAGTSDAIIFKTASQVETLRLDTAGRMIEAPGGSASLSIFGNQNAWQVYGNTLTTAGVSIGSFSASDGPHIDFFRSRSATIGQATVVQSGDDIGNINWYAAQQTGTFSNHTAAAKIRVFADGTITSGATGDMPTSMSIQTTRDGSGTLKQHVKFQANSSVIFGDDDEYTGARIQIQDTTGDDGSTIAIFRWTNDNVSGARLRMCKSRGTSRGSATIVQNNDRIATILVEASDGVGTTGCAIIAAEIDGTPGASDLPSRWIFQTSPDGSATPATSLQLGNAGTAFFPRIGTTATAANAFIDNATTPVNSLLRSTSSIRYKSNITNVPQERLDRIMSLRPIEFNSLATADNPYARFVGLSAEEVSEIDPQLVNFDAEGRPDGVQYERVLLLQVAALQQRLAILEAKGLQ